MTRRDYQDQGSADEPVRDLDEEEEAVDTAEAPEENPPQEEASTPEANVSTPQSDASPRSTRERFPWEADPTADVKNES